jgi:hypothetical protein
MIPIIDNLDIDVSCVGNHDYVKNDFLILTYRILEKLNFKI